MPEAADLTSAFRAVRQALGAEGGVSLDALILIGRDAGLPRLALLHHLADLQGQGQLKADGERLFFG